MKFEKKTLCSFVKHKTPLLLILVSTVQVVPLDRSVRYRGPPQFTFSVNNSFSMKKMEKKFLTVTPFSFWFYICVQIFIIIEQMIKILFFGRYGLLKEAHGRLNLIVVQYVFVLFFQLRDAFVYFSCAFQVDILLYCFMNTNFQ